MILGTYIPDCLLQNTTAFGTTTMVLISNCPVSSGRFIEIKK